MKMQLISDVHAETYPGHSLSFLHEVAAVEADVLVIAGDLAEWPHNLCALEILCLANKDKDIVYVLGNHEYWKVDIDILEDSLAFMQRKYTNLNVLSDSVVTIRGQRFVGSTLWYLNPERRGWSDYHLIPSFVTWQSNAAQEAAAFLSQVIRPDDIVVTHMLPSEKCVTSEWAGSSTNAFFVHDVESAIVSKKPKIWCYGHTHSANAFTIEDTRLYCNPRGLPWETSGFDPSLVIDV